MDRCRGYGPIRETLARTWPLEAPSTAAKSAAHFWRLADCNPIADTGDIAAVRKRVNGGHLGLGAVRVLYSDAAAGFGALSMFRSRRYRFSGGVPGPEADKPRQPSAPFKPLPVCTEAAFDRPHGGWPRGLQTGSLPSAPPPSICPTCRFVRSPPCWVRGRAGRGPRGLQISGSSRSSSARRQ